MNIYLSTEESLNALYGAFSQLQKEGLPIETYMIENIPLISSSNPKINYIISEFLSGCIQINTTLSIKIRNHFHWVDIFGKIKRLTNDEEIKNFFNNRIYFAFFYYDKHHTIEHSNSKIKKEQYQPFLKRFRREYGEQEGNLWAVRTDNTTTKGGSIAEGITQLIFTLYFRNRGYIVRGDIGKMMDMAIFDVPLLDKLREMYFIEKGMVPIDLLLNIPYGLVRKYSKTFNNRYKSLAIEIESYSLKEGMKQLREWIRPLKLNDIFHEYAQPFERAVVAIPKCYEEEKDIDILTYDEDGIQYIECSESNIAEKEIINQEVSQEYVKNLIVQTIYDFLPAKHFKYVSECSLLGDLSPNIRKEMEKKTLDDILSIFKETYFE